jgi:hypothetical protein
LNRSFSQITTILVQSPRDIVAGTAALVSLALAYVAVRVAEVAISITLSSAGEALQVLISEENDWKEPKARSVMALRDDEDSTMPKVLEEVSMASSATADATSASLGAGLCKSDMTLATNFGFATAPPPGA